MENRIKNLFYLGENAAESHYSFFIMHRFMNFLKCYYMNRYQDAFHMLLLLSMDVLKYPTIFLNFCVEFHTNTINSL